MKDEGYIAVRGRICSAMLGALLGFVSAFALAFTGSHNALHCLVFVPVAVTGGIFNQWFFVSAWRGHTIANMCAFILGTLANALIVYTLLYFLIERFVPFLRNG